MAIPRSAAVIAAIIAIALAGCAKPDPNAEPTYTCTPSTGTPQPCYKAEHDLQAKEDKLYAEAEAVYRKFLAEDERINRLGGISEASPALLETTTGSFLESALSVYKELKAAKATAVGGEFKVAWIRREPQSRVAGSVAAMIACTDASSVQTGSRGKASQPGTVGEQTVYFVRVDGVLKITDGTYKWVHQC